MMTLLNLPKMAGNSLKLIRIDCAATTFKGEAASV